MVFFMLCKSTVFARHLTRSLQRAQPDRYDARGGTCPDFLSGASTRAHRSIKLIYNTLKQPALHHHRQSRILKIPTQTTDSGYPPQGAAVFCFFSAGQRTFWRFRWGVLFVFSLAQAGDGFRGVQLQRLLRCRYPQEFFVDISPTPLGCFENFKKRLIFVKILEYTTDQLIRAQINLSITWKRLN
jgi:hypothetical protein